MSINFENFPNLPPEMQNEVVSHMSENDVYKLVHSNPKYFLNQLDKKGEIAKKYYTYVMNQKIYHMFKQRGPTHSKAQKVIQYISSFFVAPSKKDPVLLKDLFTKEKAGAFVSRLNLTKFSENELDVIIQNLPKTMSGMESINLDTTAVTTIQLQLLLSKCPNLKKISLKDCEQLKNLQNLPLMKSLKAIDLSTSQISVSGPLMRITPNDLKEILKCAPNLEKLSIFTNIQLVNIKLETLAPMKLLKEIEFPATAINKEDLNQLFTLCPNLEKINLSHCSHLVNLDFKNLKTMISLKEINLSETKITTNDLKQILELCPKLEKINLTKCKELKDLNFANLSPIASLKEINITNTVLTQNDLKQLTAIAPNAKIIS
jgi:hypothetical protein